MATPSIPNYNPILFQWNSPTNDLGSFVLGPVSNDSYDENDVSGVIDVFNTFDWTLTPPDGRQHIPKVILTEYRQNLSSELQGYLYSARGQLTNVQVAAAVGAPAGQAFTNNASTAVKDVTNNNALGDIAQKALNTASQQLQKISNSDAVSKLPDWATGPFSPYDGLYSIVPTGFSYVLPYYSDNGTVQVSNQWGEAGSDFVNAAGGVLGGLKTMLGGGKGAEGGTDAKTSGGPGVIGKLVQGGTQVFKNLPAMGYAATAGVSVAEKPQAYKGSSAMEDAVVDFYLYNTTDSDVTAIQKNWELCYLLTYQNLPNRKGINFLDAPCLYEVKIPGYKYLPIATLSNISVTNVGNVRLIDITTGEVVNNGNTTGPKIKMIPEAYHITLTFKGVLINSQNLFLFNADPEQSVSISVS